MSQNCANLQDSHKKCPIIARKLSLTETPHSDTAYGLGASVNILHTKTKSRKDTAFFNRKHHERPLTCKPLSITGTRLPTQPQQPTARTSGLAVGRVRCTTANYSVFLWTRHFGAMPDGQILKKYQQLKPSIQRAFCGRKSGKVQDLFPGRVFGQNFEAPNPYEFDCSLSSMNV